MVMFIWILAVVLMAFWTLLAWLSNQLLQRAGQLPWDQALQNANLMLGIPETTGLMLAPIFP